MEAKQAVPQELQDQLNGRSVEAFAPLDLNADGSYGRAWLALSEGNLVLVGPGAGLQASPSSWPLEGMKAIRIRSLTGNSFVLMGGPEGDREIGRFTQAASEA